MSTFEFIKTYLSNRLVLNKLSIFLIFVLTVFLYSSCKKKDLENIEYQIDTVLYDSIPFWEKTVPINKGGFHSIKPAIFEDEVVYFDDFNTGSYFFYNKLNGNFTSSIPNIIKGYSGTDQYYLNQNFWTIGIRNKYIQTIDLKLKKIISNYTFPDIALPTNNLSGLNDYCYASYIKYEKINDSLYYNCFPFRCNYLNNQFDTFVSIRLLYSNILNISPPVFFINNSNDTLAIYKYFEYDLQNDEDPNSPRSLNLIAININKNTIEWNIPKISIYDRNYNYDKVTIKDNIALLYNSNEIFKIDCNIGKIIQTFTIPNVFIDEISVNNNDINFVSYKNTIYNIDFQTGAIKWSYYNGLNLSNSIQTYNGVLYNLRYIDYKYELHGINLSTGKLVWVYKFKDNESIGVSDMTIDPNTGLLYSSNYEKILCIKLPKF